MFWKLGKATVPTFSLGFAQNNYFPEKVAASISHRPLTEIRRSKSRMYLNRTKAMPEKATREANSRQPGAMSSHLTVLLAN